MMRMRRTVRGVLAAAAVWAVLTGTGTAGQSCSAARDRPLVADPARCGELADRMRHPSALPLDEYQQVVGEFFGHFCQRDTASGWVRDKTVRDTGPYTQTLRDGQWSGHYHGTHAPVVVWYSPEFHDWLTTNRPLDDRGHPLEPSATTPLPDGAMVAKEMYPAPAARCAGHDPLTLLPTSGIAFFVRDARAAHDGWYWGWYGYSGWTPDWPPGPDNGLPLQGFGQYCLNCHASARDHQTFASLRNIEGQPGEPLVFLSQDWTLAEPPQSHHRLVVLPDDPAPRLGEPLYRYDAAFLAQYGQTLAARPQWDTVSAFPSAGYDNVWVPGDGPDPHSTFVTSDQCLGCHDAGGTGLQFEMTTPSGDGETLINHSPYGTWRTSPMGLAGRDPIFFAQLRSETETFHPDQAALVENVCLGCHGIQGQRQFGIDSHAEGGECRDFTRALVAAVPYPADNPEAAHADYGALARDGVSCTACHRMVQTREEIEQVKGQPQNACVPARQDLLNPQELGLSGFARTFTGSYWVGEPEVIKGPFQAPKVKPMEHALGMTPEYDDAFASSELCGSCHTVHLPVLRDGEVLGYTYEQTTYPEWLFSAYRTGSTPDGELPLGPGERAAGCLDCHMKNSEPDGSPTVSRIASIQQRTNFPEAEYVLPGEAIDLPRREGFARHTLVGLNVFLVKMAQQFPDIFGIPTVDPMLVARGQPSLITTEQAMLDNADHETAAITVAEAGIVADTLGATVAIDNRVGHKFPSGVGFRRAFVTFEVLDARGQALWTSGGTNGAGVIIDDQGQPLDGELWWADDCSARLYDEPRFQPHYQTITRQDQAQIYQELVVSPAPGGYPNCGNDPAPGGALTTSFLSICGEVKDNRLLPHGYLPLAERIVLAEAIGATETLAREATAHHVDGDPDYVSGGGDRLDYRIPLADIPGQPAAVRARLHYQAIPPFYLQDRFCTGSGPDTERLYFLAGHLNLEGTDAAGWKLELVDSGVVPLTR